MSIYTGYIYCITNNFNGKQYVGQTNTTVKQRYAGHLRCATSTDDTNSLLYLAMRKYGIDQFSVSTLEEIKADSRETLKDKLNDREIYYVDKFGTYKPAGYNMTIGGFAFADHVTRPVYKVDLDGNVVSYYDCVIDAETQNNIPHGSIKRAFSYGTHYANGYFWYDATDRRLNIGDNIGQQKKQLTPVYCFTMDGVLFKRFESVSEAEVCIGINHAHICSACRGKRLSAGGYLWSYTESPPIYEKSRRGRKVSQFTLDGIILKTYDSIAIAAIESGLQPSLISACCNGRRKSTGGYQWAFVI